jgi:hypothetical protein
VRHQQRRIAAPPVFQLIANDPPAAPMITWDTDSATPRAAGVPVDQGDTADRAARLAPGADRAGREMMSR